MKPTGEATNIILPKMASQLNTKCTTVAEVIETKDKAVYGAIQSVIDAYNALEDHPEVGTIKFK